jgi:hypothetical protein
MCRTSLNQQNVKLLIVIDAKIEENFTLYILLVFEVCCEVEVSKHQVIVPVASIVYMRHKGRCLVETIIENLSMINGRVSHENPNAEFKTHVTDQTFSQIKLNATA